MYLLTNGRIITEEAILHGYEILLKEDRIYKIGLQGTLQVDEAVEVVDAAGGYIAPGFIDIHSDYIEHMAAPRPTCLLDFSMSIREIEKELASHGITTIFHSMSLSNILECKINPIRYSDNVRKFIELISQTKKKHHLIRHRFHARFEIDNFNDLSRLISYIEENKVDLVSFMDHTPGQGQYRDLQVFRTMVKSYDELNDEEIDDMIAHHQSKEKVTMVAMKQIADMAQAKGIAVASHDDDTLEKVELVQKIGATISEFPITMEVAQAAKAKGMFTMAGAPNVLLGGSHSGNLSAAEAIMANNIDILCSDYYPPALLHAVFAMHQKFGLSLVDMFKLLTINPAKAVHMDEEIGSIKEGKKADLIIIKKIDADFPVITIVMVDGKLIQRINYEVGD